MTTIDTTGWMPGLWFVRVTERGHEATHESLLCGDLVDQVQVDLDRVAEEWGEDHE